MAQSATSARAARRPYRSTPRCRKDRRKAGYPDDPTTDGSPTSITSAASDSGYGAWVVIDPNNPTGDTTPLTPARARHRRHHTSDARDEVYADLAFEGGRRLRSRILSAGDHLSSLSKAYLARGALRVVAVGATDVDEVLRRSKSSRRTVVQ